MTLILTVNSCESIWLLADRRLSSLGRTVKDDACKIMVLETRDGVALLGYAGLGATAFPFSTEPSDWMSAVLRCRRNLLQKEALYILTKAMERELTPHLLTLPGNVGPVHNLLAPAFLGKEVQLYSIDLELSSDRTRYKYGFGRKVYKYPTMPRPMTIPLGMAGSGSEYLTRNRKWMRPLVRLVRNYNRGKVSAYAVADHLARLNYEVHLNTCDKSVGPRCMVAWLNRKDGFHKQGGAQQYYTGIERDLQSGALPTIANGWDSRALVNAILPSITKKARAILDGEAQFPDKDELNGLIARLPKKPDEKLR